MKAALIIFSMAVITTAFASDSQQTFSGSASKGAEEFMGCWEVKEEVQAEASAIAKGQAELACAKLGLHANQISDFILNEQCKTTGKYYAWNTTYTATMTGKFNCR